MSREFSISVIRRLQEEGHTAYWAGGCVRDLLRNVVPKDYDVATDASPDAVRGIFGKGSTLAVGESFGVVIVLGPRGSGDQVEVATFRREGDYLDGRRPSSVSFCTAEEDARRRDFTINGMFYDPLTDAVHDYVQGEEDLKNRIVRAIGDPRARMSEDKLRLLRAVRFASALEFQISAETAQAVSDMASQVVIVSAERIAQELKRMLADIHRARAMELCEQLGLLAVILPEVHDYTIRVDETRWGRIVLLLAELGEATFEVALAALLRDVPTGPDRGESSLAPTGSVLAVCRRLRLSNEETDRILWLSQHRCALENIDRASLADVKRLLTHPDFPGLFQLERTAAHVEGKSAEPFEWIDRFLRETPAGVLNPPELVNGRDLIQLGYSPGPRFKEWLTSVRDAQLNGEIHSRDEALALVERLAGK